MEFNFAGGLADIINQSKRKLEDEANADADVSLTWWQWQYCWQVYMVPLFRWLLQFGKKRKNRKRYISLVLVHLPPPAHFRTDCTCARQPCDFVCAPIHSWLVTCVLFFRLHCKALKEKKNKTYFSVSTRSILFACWCIYCTEPAYFLFWRTRNVQNTGCGRGRGKGFLIHWPKINLIYLIL